MNIEDVREHVEFLVRANEVRLHYSWSDREIGVCDGVALTCNKILNFLASAGEAGTAETPKSGSARRASTRRLKAGTPK